MAVNHTTSGINGSPIQGATQSSLTLKQLSLATAGDYWVTINNEFGPSKRSQTTQLSIEWAPVITKQPQALVYQRITQPFRLRLMERAHLSTSGLKIIFPSQMSRILS